MSMARLLAGVALVGLMAQPALAQAQDQPQPQPAVAAGAEQLAQQDMDFATTAAGDGMAEVMLGELAKERAESDQVKEFAQRMVDDHGQANDQLTSIAQQKGIELPTAVPDEAQKAMDELQQKSGAEFDQAYMELMVQDHEKAVDLFEQEAQSGEDQDLRSFAEATLPTLEEHLDLAQQAQEPMTAAADSQDAGPSVIPSMAEQQASAPVQDMGAGATPPEGLQVTNQPMQTKGAGDAQPADQQAAEAMPDQGADQPVVTQPMPDQQQAASEPSTDEQAASEPMADQPAEAMSAQQPAADVASGAAVRAEDVIGTDVVNTNGDEVGEINDLVIDANQVEYAVVSVGGFLGIGDKQVAIPLDQLKLGADKSYLLSAETVDQLKELPEFDESQYQPRG